MEIGGQSVPAVLLVLGALAVVAMAFVLADLYRHDVKHLPKWAWAAIVVLGNFPLGAIAYFVVGRQAAGEGGNDPVDDRPGDRRDEREGGSAPLRTIELESHSPTAPATDRHRRRRRRDARAEQAVRQRCGARRRGSRRAPRGDLRADRSQRRRQDHVAVDPRRPAKADHGTSRSPCRGPRWECWSTPHSSNRG
jgi:hypothetical protein